MKKENNISRRSFLKSSAMVGAAGAIGTGGAASLLTSCGGASEGSAPAYTPLKEAGSYYIPNLVDVAADGKKLGAAIIGCGGRGSGAALNFLDAANDVTIVALADAFKDRVDALADKLKKERNIDIPEANRFVGLDAYKKAIDVAGVDVVLDCTPPNFRPYHFKYATEKGKHSFLEKPICVDPAGYRVIMASAKQAEAKGLSCITGTQRHHQRSYVESYKKVMEGLIGEITGGTVYWNQSMLWFRERQKEWSDCEFMIRDWVNWKWLSGDHIVEQHVHNIDVFTWFSGLKPVKAVGMGSRQRRVTGDQYDFFSIDFTMENGIHMHSMCRQIDGCTNNVSEFIQGTKGSWDSSTMEIKDLDGKVIWKYDSEAEKNQFKQTNPYTLEHVNWINTIRSNKPIMQATETAVSNMGAIMGRESAYSGTESTWETMTASPIDYMPKDLNIGKMDMSDFTVKVPGKPREEKK